MARSLTCAGVLLGALPLFAAAPAAALEVAATFTIRQLPAVVDLNGPLREGSDHVATFVTGGGPVELADPSAATLTDLVQDTVAGAAVRIANQLDGADERLDAEVVGTVIAKSYDAATGRLVLTGLDTVANYQAVLRTLVYENVSLHPHRDIRRITVAVDDGTAEGPAAVCTVTLQPGAMARAATPLPSERR
jgi:hypothetical protein